MEALGKHHIHKYPSKFTENLSNLTQNRKNIKYISKRNRKYNRRITSRRKHSIYNVSIKRK